VTGFAEELIAESIGTSSKKWALLLLAAIAGAAAALWLTGRAHVHAPDAAPTQVEATAGPGQLSSTDAGPAASNLDSVAARLYRTRPMAMLRHRFARGGAAAAESADEPR
jgi:hypothetical protein